MPSTHGNRDLNVDGQSLRCARIDDGNLLPTPLGKIDPHHRLSPELLRGLGISRVGASTGLDVIGLPVWFATRPGSRTLSVSQGKGLTDAHARVSAVMESIESAVSEQAERLISQYGSAVRISERGLRSVPVERSAICNAARFDVQRERGWVAGRSHLSSEAVYAPFELVGLDLRSAAPWDHGAFRMTSIGLGAGFSFHQAALHALLELVEHDACYAAEIFGHRGAGIETVQWAEGLHAGLDEAMSKLRAVGLDAEFFHLPGRFGLPVIGCSVAREVENSTGPAERRAGGFACRFDAGDAALAALLEAVQSRLTYIAGARDDIAAEQYAAPCARADRVGAKPLQALIAAFRSDLGLNVEARYAEACRRVLDAGIGDIFEFDLAAAPEGIHVVRIVAPGLRIAFDDGVTVVEADLVGAFLNTLARAS